MTDPRPLLLKHILPLVPFDGWSDCSLLQAVKNAGAEPQELKRVFPGGPADCIDYFFASEDEALAMALPAPLLSEKRVPDRIEALILTRLAHFAPHREAVRRAIAHYGLPWNAMRACRSLYRTVDLMWRLAGDQALDFNFYTKRMTLAGVYSSSTLFWLNDTSENHADTEAFVKRRLAGVAAFGKWKKELTGKFSAAF